MRRWFWCILCALLGLVMTTAGLLIPAHLRAVEAKVIELAGRKSRTRTVTEEGFALLEQKQPGPAQTMLLAARLQHLPEADRLGLAVGNFAMAHPKLVFWGCSDVALENLFQEIPEPRESASPPVAAVLVRLENRPVVFKLLEASTDTAVQSILGCRGLTNTLLFPPASSASGQAYDTAIALTALLIRQQDLSPSMCTALAGMARQVAQGASSARFEQALLDFISLGQRFDWGQLAAFVRQIEDPETLRHLAHLARKAKDELPVLFAAVQLSGKPAAVVAYLMEFSESGLKDLGISLRYGTGGVKEILERKQRIIQDGLRRVVIGYDPFGAFYYFALDYCWLMPGLALAGKWLFYLAGGFYLAAALHFARPAPTPLERPLLVPGFSMARELLFALGFLLVVLLLSEPFLSQESQKVDLPFRPHLPSLGGAVPAGITRAHPTNMNQANQLSLLTLLLFFVLQALIYTACLVKLAEIRRQEVPPRMKLRLLENEDHLFDAGLYLGFVGTIISLILVSMGVIKPSLMAAYSSTSFGIIFVSILKIFHVRPLRRKLILESETSSS